MIITIYEQEDVEKLLNESDKRKVFLLKHSITCPVSARAFSIFEEFSKQNPKVHCYLIEIQNSRELSTFVAEYTKIEHESPQILVFRNKNIVWNESHYGITLKALNNQLNS